MEVMSWKASSSVVFCFWCPDSSFLLKIKECVCTVPCVLLVSWFYQWLQSICVVADNRCVSQWTISFMTRCKYSQPQLSSSLSATSNQRFPGMHPYLICGTVSLNLPQPNVIVVRANTFKTFSTTLLLTAYLLVQPFCVSASLAIF